MTLDGSGPLDCRAVVHEANTLETIVPDAIWVSERPIKFSGVWLRARTTVIRLENGDLWVHSPCPPTDALQAALDTLGPVRWLVIPNRFHHLGTPPMAAVYPDARVIGPTSVLARNAEVSLTMATTDPEAAIPEIEVLPLSGVPFLDETLFFHRSTQTLIGTDVVLMACARDHWSWRWAARAMGCYDTLRIPLEVRIMTRPNDEAARAVDRMLACPMKRLLVAHADVIDDRPKERLAEAWQFTRR